MDGMDGKASLYPGRDGSFDVQVLMLPEHMAALEQDEFWLLCRQTRRRA
jgi:hypothetical protein